MWFDGELYYSVQMDRFSFDESRYINSYIDYEEFILSGRRFQKTWIDPGNKLGIYQNTRRGGNLRLTDGNPHPVKIELKDLHGNTAVLEFTLLSRFKKVEREAPVFTQYMPYDEHNHFVSGDFTIDIVEESLYEDLKFNYRKINNNGRFFSDIHIVHDDKVPLHKNAVLSIKTADLPARYQNKALVVMVDTITGKVTSAGGSYIDGSVSSSIRNFGNFAVMVDTIPPVIVPLSFKADGELNESSRIRFRITDSLSGIKEYRGTLNGKWALFDYDAKTNTLVHYFDPKRFELGKRHNFVLEVTDHKDNIKVYETSFWK